MTCHDCQQLLELYALDALDEDEAEKVRAHLDTGCGGCAGQLIGVRSVLDTLPLAIAPVVPATSARARLMERISTASRRADVRKTVWRPAFLPLWFGRFAQALVGGAVAALLTAGVFWRFIDQQRSSVASLREELEQAESAIRQLRTSVSQTNQTIQLFQSPAVQLVSLDGTAVQPRAKARVFWDQTRGQWHFYASNLKPLADGKVYELWLIDSDQRKIPAGTFTVENNGEAAVTAHSPPDSSRVVALAVTDEPAGGAPQPTGQIQLLGQFK